MKSIFFFKAEDGIRYRNVTGVQTCALPIFEPAPLLLGQRRDPGPLRHARAEAALARAAAQQRHRVVLRRSEERRVGKERRARWAQSHHEKEEERRSAWRWAWIPIRIIICIL